MYKLTQDLKTQLTAKGFPISVSYGPERAPRSVVRTHVVVQYDRGRDDLYRAPRGVNRNPRQVMTREARGLVTVAAAASVPGARLPEHEGLALQIVDAVAVFLFQWGTKNATPVGIDGGRFLAEPELKESIYETWPGVVYQMSISVPRAVRDVNFVGSALETVILDAVSTDSVINTPGAGLTEAGPAITTD